MLKHKRSIFLGLLLAPIVQFAQAAETDATASNHNAASYQSSESCSHALNATETEDQLHSLNTDKLTILSWNIEKGLNTGWEAELAELTRDVQLTLLQEAVLIDEMIESPGETQYWSFSAGYQTASLNSGIMTLSGVEPDIICSLKKKEPWLKSPKIASITRFPLEQNEQSLLLVNIHQINFTLGISAFSQQLEEVVSVLEAHQGPIIFSGDFNTWRQSRLNFLNQRMAALGLSAASFSPDYRKQAFGYYLDHIFIRGFDVVESRTVKVESSDHNPLIITLSLAEV